MASEVSESIAAMIVERAADREAKWAAKTVRRKLEREAKQRARDAGLVQRYARKAARIQQQTSIT